MKHLMMLAVLALSLFAAPPPRADNPIRECSTCLRADNPIPECSTCVRADNPIPECSTCARVR